MGSGTVPTTGSFTQFSKEVHKRRDGRSAPAIIIVLHNKPRHGLIRLIINPDSAGARACNGHAHSSAGPKSSDRGPLWLVADHASGHVIRRFEVDVRNELRKAVVT